MKLLFDMSNILDACKLSSFPFSTNFLKPVWIYPLQDFDLKERKAKQEHQGICAKQGQS